eukprot:scaffold77253_cov60-Phaeocystis_antarctica.AAC.4
MYMHAYLLEDVCEGPVGVACNPMYPRLQLYLLEDVCEGPVGVACNPTYPRLQLHLLEDVGEGPVGVACNPTYPRLQLHLLEDVCEGPVGVEVDNLVERGHGPEDEGGGGGRVVQGVAQAAAHVVLGKVEAVGRHRRARRRHLVRARVRARVRVRVQARSRGRARVRVSPPGLRSSPGPTPGRMGTCPQTASRRRWGSGAMRRSRTGCPPPDNARQSPARARAQRWPGRPPAVAGPPTWLGLGLGLGLGLVEHSGGRAAHLVRVRVRVRVSRAQRWPGRPPVEHSCGRAAHQQRRVHGLDGACRGVVQRYVGLGVGHAPQLIPYLEGPALHLVRGWGLHLEGPTLYLSQAVALYRMRHGGVHEVVPGEGAEVAWQLLDALVVELERSARWRARVDHGPDAVAVTLGAPVALAAERVRLAVAVPRAVGDKGGHE